MPTIDAVLDAFALLTRQVVAATVPPPRDTGDGRATIEEVAADWCDLLPDVDDAQLARAVRAHLRTPERGRWWPAVADIMAHVEVEPAASDPHEDAWAAIEAHIRSGDEGGVAGLLTAGQMEAFRLTVGSIYDLRRAEPAKVGFMRRRFLEVCRAADAPKPATPPRIAASAPHLGIVDGGRAPRRIGGA